MSKQKLFMTAKLRKKVIHFEFFVNVSLDGEEEAAVKKMNPLFVPKAL